MDKTGCEKPVVIIEHLEEGITPWILLEYRHISRFYGSECVIFTNMPAKYHGIIRKYGTPLEESIVDIIGRNAIKAEDVIILDPSSPKELTYDILSKARYVVIGGILGDHPPKKRTWEYISSRLGHVAAYNIGKGQYSIDGAVYYIYYMYVNKSMDGYKYVDGLALETPSGIIHLPFRYPMVDGKPFISEELVYYIVNRKIPENVWKEITGK